MNEIKHIHLGRQQFTISLEAYAALRAYIDAIKEQMNIGGGDVIDEIELRMAELLTERGITADKVILPADITYLQEQLGQPDDFKEDAEEPPAKVLKEEETTRRLFRDTGDAMIAGVAAGLAKYLNIDPVIVRIIFIALALLGGSGILIYVLLWLLVPEAKTASDRLSMQGKAATIDNLKRVVERADLPGAARCSSNIVAGIVAIFGRIILLVIGLPLAIGSGIALLGTMAMSTYILVDGFKVAGHVVAPIGGREVVGFVAGVVAVLCVLLLMMLVGIAMVRRRWQLPVWGVAALVGIFFLSASVGGALAADVESGIRHRVEGLQHTRLVQLGAFDAVNVSGPETSFSYVPDGKDYVRYTYWGSADVKKLQNTIKDGRLTISTKGADTNICDNFCAGVNPGIWVEVHGPKLATVTINNREINLRPPCRVVESGELSVNCPVPIESLPVQTPAGVTDNS